MWGRFRASETALGLMPVKLKPLWNCYPVPFPKVLGKQLSFRVILAMIFAQSEHASESLASQAKG
jgi:hypothetical protein